MSRLRLALSRALATCHGAFLGRTHVHASATRTEAAPAAKLTLSEVRSRHRARRVIGALIAEAMPMM